MQKKLLIIVVVSITLTMSPCFAGSGTDNAFEAIFRGLASIGDGKSGKNASAPFRISGGYTNGSIVDNDFDKTVLTGVNRPEGTYGEIDTGGTVSLHFGVSKSFDKQTKLNFNGGGLKDAEIELTRYQYGIKINVPGKVVNPYLGGGYITGPFRMTDKSSTTETEYMQTLHGSYWNAGVDILFGAHVGIRLGYQGEEYIDEEFHDLDETLRIKIRSGRAGLLFYF